MNLSSVHMRKRTRRSLYIPSMRQKEVIFQSSQYDVSSPGLQQLRNAFGQGQHLRWIPVHELWVYIGSQKSRDIHAFTRWCWVYKGKKMWCDVFPTDVLRKLCKFPPTVIDDDMEISVRFVSKCMTDDGPALPWQWIGADVCRYEYYIIMWKYVVWGCLVQHIYCIIRTMIWSDLLAQMGWVRSCNYIYTIILIYLYMPL